MLKTLFALVLSASALAACAGTFQGAWKTSRDDISISGRTSDEAVVSATLKGGISIFVEPERSSFRPSREVFDASSVSMTVSAEGFQSPLKAWLFVKDKDGAWFQSEKEFLIVSGKSTRLEVEIDRAGRGMFPIGHSAVWNAQAASAIFDIGISIYSEAEQGGTLRLMRPEYSGVRERGALEVKDWRPPEKAYKNTMFSSTFSIPREFFNPFDPDEIAADYEVVRPDMPDDAVRRYPAFFTCSAVSSSRFVKEETSLSGLPFWELRYMPQTEGKYKIRLRLACNSSRAPEVFTTPWRDFEVLPSKERGAVRVSKKDSRYFEFADGTFFYPVGINIHSNTDMRGENAFGFGHLPDRGNPDYYDYIDACAARGGMTLIEIWMAAWTYAIEWSSSYRGFYGTGRYNLVNAWRLDRVIEFAKKRGVCINLVFDNHGKLAETGDPEWHDAPQNRKGLFGTANNAILDSAADFWTDASALKANHARTRYICARWGAFDNIFSFQLWSEVDLTTNSRQKYDKDILGKWHSDTANDIKAMSCVPHLCATHVCGEVGNTDAWKKITIALPELTHVCSDAYRDSKISILKQLERHKSVLEKADKPIIVTEYGDTGDSASGSRALADVHAGQWASIFTNQAGGPMLWWHDFVHMKNHYQHYKGFSLFMRGVDLRGKDSRTGTIEVSSSPLSLYKLPEDDFLSKVRASLRSRAGILNPKRAEPLEGRVISPDGLRFYGWIFVSKLMAEYPYEREKAPAVWNIRCVLPFEPAEGYYTLEFFDTVTNAVLSSRKLFIAAGRRTSFSVPALKTDIAFKLLPSGEGESSGK